MTGEMECRIFVTAFSSVARWVNLQVFTVPDETQVPSRSGMRGINERLCFISVIMMRCWISEPRGTDVSGSVHGAGVAS